jgi:hypothetical protein
MTRRRHPQKCLGEKIYLGADALKAVTMKRSISLDITCGLLKIN